MQRPVILCILTACCYIPVSFAGSDADIDLSRISGNQVLFDGLVEDLGAALSYKALSPAESLGILGFDIGIEATLTKMESDALEAVNTDSAPSSLLVPKVHAHKGLPFGIDVGVLVTSIPSSNMSVVGAEIKYAIIEGNTVLPAIAVRGTYSKLSGVDDFSLNTKGLEFSISKGFLLFTPYAGIGKIRISGDSSGTLANTLSGHSVTQNKTFIGLNVNFGLMNIAAETEKTGDNSTTSVKFGLRF